MSDSAALDSLLALSRAHAAANASLDAALSRVGLWLDDLAVLTAIDHAGAAGATRSALAADFSTPQSEMLRRLKPWEKLSWIERTGSGSFVLTAQGRALVIEATGLAANRSEAWFDGVLSAAEIDVLETLLDRLSAR